ncbi:MAG: hypothetical protein FWD97_04395 [Defluviitaleaceae bacterium]|nr:hypothetical protein [Defluviitaleaceae bacterium]
MKLYIVTIIYLHIRYAVGRARLLGLDAYAQTLLPADFYNQLNFTYAFTMWDTLNHSAGFADFFLVVFFDPETLDETISLR